MEKLNKSIEFKVNFISQFLIISLYIWSVFVSGSLLESFITNAAIIVAFVGLVVKVEVIQSPELDAIIFERFLKQLLGKRTYKKYKRFLKDDALGNLPFKSDDYARVKNVHYIGGSVLLWSITAYIDVLSTYFLASPDKDKFMARYKMLESDHGVLIQFDMWLDMAYDRELHDNMCKYDCVLHKKLELVNDKNVSESAVKYVELMEQGYDMDSGFNKKDEMLELKKIILKSKSISDSTALESLKATVSGDALNKLK